MNVNSPQPPEDLLREIARNLQPQRPGPTPFRLALRMLPTAALICLAILMWLGVRRDAAALGPFVTWGISILQIGLAVILVWMSAREGTPSRRLPGNAVWLAIAANALLIVAVALWIFAESAPRILTLRRAWIAAFICGGGATVAGGLVVAALAWLLRRSMAARPAVAGALYGAGAGMAVNAGWRLACPNPNLSHSLGVHGGSILLTTLLGAWAASYVARWRSTRLGG